MLDDLFTRYASGQLDRKDFEGKIFTHLFENRRHFFPFYWKREQCGDFLSWLYPRLQRAITFYEKRNESTFDGYIASLVYWCSREYHLQNTIRDQTERTFWQERSRETQWTCDTVGEETPAYEATPQKDGEPLVVSNPRQVLILVLKSYYFLSPDFISRIAPALRMDEAALHAIVTNVRERQGGKEEKSRLLLERITSQFYRCLCFQQRLESAPENSARYFTTERSLKRARIRLASMQKRLACLRRAPSNRLIAEVLGCSKGTIDSALHILKEKSKR